MIHVYELVQLLSKEIDIVCPRFRDKIVRVYIMKTMINIIMTYVKIHTIYARNFITSFERERERERERSKELQERKKK